MVSVNECNEVRSFMLLITPLVSAVAVKNNGDDTQVINNETFCGLSPHAERSVLFITNTRPHRRTFG
jgi:hypothetical protein